MIDGDFRERIGVMRFDLGGIHALDAIERECLLAGIEEPAIITAIRRIVTSGVGDVHSVLNAMNHGVVFASNVGRSLLQEKQDSEEVDWVKEGF
jgi:hypothetical protein